MLVVDDDEMTIHALGRILTLRGWKVDEARNAADALRALDVAPDCIILDLSLVDGEGERFLEEVRAREIRPYIIVTSRYSSPERIRAISDRFTPFALFVKPVPPAEFLAVCDGARPGAPIY